jgi:large subunit ribosomal protein L24
MSRIQTHVHKGDSVVVITGNFKGASGKILQVIPEKGQVIIEGVRMIKKHQKKTQKHPEGGIMQREGPIHISNVKRLEKKTGEKKEKKTTRKKAK